MPRLIEVYSWGSSLCAAPGLERLVGWMLVRSVGRILQCSTPQPPIMATASWISGNNVGRKSFFLFFPRLFYFLAAEQQSNWPTEWAATHKSKVKKRNRHKAGQGQKVPTC